MGSLEFLRLWVAAKARGRASKQIKRACQERGWSEPTFRRKRTEALRVIADGLNAAREVVF